MLSSPAGTIGSSRETAIRVAQRTNWRRFKAFTGGGMTSALWCGRTCVTRLAGFRLQAYRMETVGYRGLVEQSLSLPGHARGRSRQNPMDEDTAATA